VKIYVNQGLLMLALGPLEYSPGVQWQHSQRDQYCEQQHLSVSLFPLPLGHRNMGGIFP